MHTLQLYDKDPDSTAKWWCGDSVLQHRNFSQHLFIKPLVILNVEKVHTFWKEGWKKQGLDGKLLLTSAEPVLPGSPAAWKRKDVARRMEEYCRENKAYLTQLEGGQKGSFIFSLISYASGNGDKQRNAES